MAAQKAVVDSNAANVRRLQQLQSFEKVYAPFDGVITARSTDIGALIDAGSSAQGKELFHLAAISTIAGVRAGSRGVFERRADLARQRRSRSTNIQAAYFAGSWCATRAPSILLRARCWWK